MLETHVPAGNARIHAFVHGCPIDIREEGFNVLGSLGGLVVQEECVLPNVNHEQRLEARDVADLVSNDSTGGR